ncbi:UNVERIFIED_CONTAM: Triose-phosphate Transporter [Siphonaria sp. JEL0065]|nr:Triose-phosphate Transporter [Siphonaria sp. JEL0065]
MHGTSKHAGPPSTHKTLLTLAYILAWYSTSLGLSMYNKWLFSKDHLDFRYPLFTSTIHMVMQFLLSAMDYFLKVLPCGVATGLDIGLSNSSLKTISLSFYTMVKSGAPVFVLLFAFLFRLEKPTWKLTSIILLICSGVLLMVGTETKFNLQGYLEVQIATVLSGFRWSITQILLAHASLGMTNPLATSLFLSPVMAVSLLITSLFAEDFSGLLNSPMMASNPLQLIGMLCFGGFLAFLMVMSEFQLIRVTSVVTFSVAGVFKEVLTIAISLMVFKDGEFTFLKGCGLVLSIVGIGIYNYVRIVAAREEKERYQGSGVSGASSGRKTRRARAQAAREERKRRGKQVVTGDVSEGGGRESFGDDADSDEDALLDESGLWIEDDDLEDSDDEAVAAIYGMGLAYNHVVVANRKSLTNHDRRPTSIELSQL